MRDWTQEQKTAIESGTNLLVSAAAGSGKTAVLVERIIRKLIPDSSGNYLPVDRLLVVTFARDAAREMQERIKKSLSGKAAAEKNSEIKRVLAGQIKKLPFADITTIDGFCMHLVKQNFHLLGIDSKFSIMDSSEAKVYVFECINEYFDMLYESGSSDFLLLTSLYCTGYDDRELADVLYDVFIFTRSLPDPKKWLEAHAEDYKSFSESSFRTEIEKAFASSAAYACAELEGLQEAYKKAVGSEDDEILCGFGKYDFWTLLKNDINTLKSIKPQWDDIFENRSAFEVLRKTSSSKQEEQIQKSFIDLRENALSELRTLLGMVKVSLSEADAEYEKSLYPHALALSRLVNGFADFYFDRKNKACKFEFNDLEHLTIRLLRENDDIRQALTDKYAEILMDEYQDTNGLQEEIFSMISTGDNRFTVGDMKQSIYRFRQSDPMIFRDKDESYQANPELGERVILSKNFRSRKGVLDSINYLFERIMTYNVGEVNYNSEQALHYGNTMFDAEAEGNAYESELYVLEGAPSSADEDSVIDTELEAEFVAGKIKSMIDSGFQVLDGGEFRSAEPGDFAILMNAVKNTSEYYVNALMKRGINAYSEDVGFFQKTEIRMIIEFIRAVNNPMRDIPLVSVMRSPIYRFTDEELAAVRLASSGEFWNAVKARSRGGDRLAEKCGGLISDINRWRDMSRYMSADRLIWRILTESSLYDMSGILYGGEAAPANLRLFMERARILSDGGIATLYDFEKYLSRIINSEGLSCASVTNTGIPIMTIHKSKGLEFPVVFVCGMGRKFVSDDSGKKIFLHKDYGFGLRNINPERSFATSTVNKSYISAVKRNEAMSEQIRKLYVALTRAKEKLIITGVAKYSENKKTSAKTTFDFTGAAVNEKSIALSKKYLDFVAPVIKKCSNGLWSYHETEYKDIDVSPKPEEEKEAQTIDIETVRQEVYRLLDQFDSISTPPAVASKISVSELKSRSGYSAKLQRLPAFMEAEETRGASFGTAVHKVMENIVIVPDMTDEYIKSETERICGSETEIISRRITDFFRSTLGIRALGGRIKREEAFEIEIPAIDLSGNEIPGETMLLQGVIDLYFEDDKGLVLVDYKTDKCSDIRELADKYSVQLKWYKYAMEKLMGKEVSEVYIYSFHKNDAIEISERI
ncbi:MAG: UvrD-helicase domain-containing protein [Clostridia bacterium]|nr:UvrD-helicase domain-containing protein [Clostridia bacterium]